MDHAYTNRLSRETSPYLLQHAHNPVDWYAWGEEALKKAKAEDKPILLSVGYAACHWCHVMERESFEDPRVAQVMNEHFVCVKVDREERPDLDRIYQSAVQMMGVHGGWPLTAFLTPDGEPFYGGTYYPPEDRHGLPAFTRVLLSVSRAWREDRDEVRKAVGQFLEALGHLNRFQ
ncbi:MAG: thioredoxin domain-containing protein, partial [candidate division NC10 bacterium]|nr:thioredoxin domain-containing protein [candidate division NC10 bacterium]